MRDGGRQPTFRSGLFFFFVLVVLNLGTLALLFSLSCGGPIRNQRDEVHYQFAWHIGRGSIPRRRIDNHVSRTGMSSLTEREGDISSVDSAGRSDGDSVDDDDDDDDDDAHGIRLVLLQFSPIPPQSSCQDRLRPGPFGTMAVIERSRYPDAWKTTRSGTV